MGLAFRLTQAATTLLTICFVMTALSPVQQGYLFTFLGILAAQQLLELGLSTVIMQVTSHESIGMEWDERLALFPQESTAIHLAKMLTWAQIWFAGMAFLFLVTVVPAGWILLSADHHSTVRHSWEGPWLVAGFMCALNLLFAPTLAVLEGCGRISDVYLFKIWQEVLASLGLWIGLLSGMGLYSLGIFLAIRVAVCLAFIFSGYRRFLLQLWRHRVSPSPGFVWARDIWPLQWRTSLSFGAGYLIFQFNTPIVFALHGPIVAGQWALTYTIVFSIGQFWITWVAARAPELGNLAAQHEYKRMEMLFFRDLRHSTTACATGLILAYLVLCGGVKLGLPYMDRLLDLQAAGLICAWGVVNHVVNVMAIHLRAHREEPYLLPSLVGGVLIPTSVYYLGGLFGTFGIAMSYLVITSTVGLGWGGWIFFRKLQLRREMST